MITRYASNLNLVNTKSHNRVEKNVNHTNCVRKNLRLQTRGKTPLIAPCKMFHTYEVDWLYPSLMTIVLLNKYTFQIAFLLLLSPYISFEDWTVVPSLETDAVFGLFEWTQEIDSVDAERRLGVPRDCKLFDKQTSWHFRRWNRWNQKKKEKQSLF